MIMINVASRVIGCTVVLVEERDLGIIIIVIIITTSLLYKNKNKRVNNCKWTQTKANGLLGSVLKL